MNTTTLLNLFRDAINNNETITGWCMSYYGRAQTLYKGMDQRNPPGEALYPIIHLYPISKSTGHAEESTIHGIGVTCGIYDDDHTRTQGDNGEVWEYDGIDRLEAFRKLIEGEILSAVPDDVLVDRLSIEYETIEFFPFLLASMELTLSQPHVIGVDLFV